MAAKDSDRTTPPLFLLYQSVVLSFTDYGLAMSYNIKDTSAKAEQSVERGNESRCWTTKDTTTETTRFILDLSLMQT